MLLSKEDIENLIKQKSLKWELVGGRMIKHLEFKNFDDAFAFMITVANICKEEVHHPYWSNEYNKVSIELITHDFGRVTMKDIVLAERIDTLL